MPSIRPCVRHYLNSGEAWRNSGISCCSARIVSAIGLAGWRIDRLWGTLGAAIVALVTADVTT
jgi:hypothetical protein